MSPMFPILPRSLASAPRLITRSVRSFSTTPHSCSRKKSASVASNGPTTTTTTKTSTATLAPMQTRNPFAPPPNSVLAYVGPYARSLRQAKAVAFVFGACGCIAVPAMLYLGNTEHFLAVMAATASVSPSVLLHTLFRNDVTKIHVQGSPSTKVPAVVRVSSSDPLKLTMEKLSWRGSPKLTQVQSTSLFVQSATDKTVTWTTASATIPPPYTPNSSSRTSTTQPAATSRPTKETYRVDKLMMLSNPSFSFVMDQIEHQSRLSHGTHTSDTTHSSSKDSKK